MIALRVLALATTFVGGLGFGAAAAVLAARQHPPATVGVVMYAAEPAPRIGRVL